MGNEEIRIQGPTGYSPMAYEDYDEQYPLIFAGVENAIHSVLPSARVEHVGSTSIPGLGGRRTLDIVLPAPAEMRDQMESKLLSLGFIKSPFAHFLPMLIGSIQHHGKDYGILLYIV